MTGVPVIPSGLMLPHPKDDRGTGLPTESPPQLFAAQRIEGLSDIVLRGNQQHCSVRSGHVPIERRSIEVADDAGVKRLVEMKERAFSQVRLGTMKLPLRLGSP